VQELESIAVAGREQQTVFLPARFIRRPWTAVVTNNGYFLQNRNERDFILGYFWVEDILVLGLRYQLDIFY
jgi:hypothetical protein